MLASFFLWSLWVLEKETKWSGISWLTRIPHYYAVQEKCIKAPLLNNNKCVHRTFFFFLTWLFYYKLPSFFFKIYFYIYFWLCWVFVSVRGLSLVAASGGHSSLRCAGLSPSRPLLLRSTGSRRAGSVVVAHGPSRSTACGILPDQGSNLCPLHWQADSQPLRHQGSPTQDFDTTWQVMSEGSLLIFLFILCCTFQFWPMK